MAAVAPARAQGEYYNLDSGRPSQIEDATPTLRYELERQLAPARHEAVAGGVRRARLKPKISYGIAPLRELQVRSQFITSDSRVTSRCHLASSAWALASCVHWA